MIRIYNKPLFPCFSESSEAGSQLMGNDSRKTKDVGEEHSFHETTHRAAVDAAAGKCKIASLPPSRVPLPTPSRVASIACGLYHTR